MCILNYNCFYKSSPLLILMKLGIIGGSGLEKANILENTKDLEIETPYGLTKVKKGLYKNIEVFIISRHGPNHEIMPSHVNNRANIFALANLGCKKVIATTACGSLREEITRGEFVIPDQLIDFTKFRITSFSEDFKQGINHISFAEPFSEDLRKKLIRACDELGFVFKPIATLITIEGPRFSTRAESRLFRAWGADIINMSTSPEASLAREAGLEYAVIAMSTDYDAWKEEEAVTWEEISRIIKNNAENVKNVLIRVMEDLAYESLREKDKEFIKSSIRAIPDFPKQGIMFRDITTLLNNPEAFKKVVEIFVERYKDRQIDVVAGIESRGFIFGAILAEKLSARFVPIRKPGKLPGEVERQEYELEYGKDAVEIHKDAINVGDRVLIIDDLLATSGTMKASCNLIKKLRGEIEDCAVIIELEDLGGRNKLREGGFPLFSIITFKENE